MNAVPPDMAEEMTSAADRHARRRRLLLLAAPVVALMAGAAIYLWSGRYESTDNAYVQRVFVPITPKVAGQVVAVDVKENQPVKTGQPLFRIDPAAFELAVAEAAANLAEAQAGNGRGGASLAVQRAQVNLDRARLMLASTVVRAPQDGIVTKVNQLQVGNVVGPARPVFALAGNRVWIEANFKESQLSHMRVGQPAVFRIDALPDLALRGRLESFSPGTGSSFSVLPPENATGNWVKVVQRLPVQFTIDNRPAGIVLSGGLSVEVTVDIRHARNPSKGGGPLALLSAI